MIFPPDAAMPLADLFPLLHIMSESHAPESQGYKASTVPPILKKAMLSLLAEDGKKPRPSQ
jgi:hypothetical protein